ncbi:hypothetical protein SLS62_000135 [Diatrype stigma]|uniref:MMS19 nucleotide excision repair protein n=1 Tax=Diatrype stigma TaxID=117547 RepID=A0AAN9YX07_9PEZI
MATVGFPELALQYVLSDDPEEAKVAAQKAASMIEASTNNRVLVGQWVSSINRWMPSASSDDGAGNGGQDDDDFISRAKALEFLASTLAVLKRDALKAEQVKLLVNFFCSLFSSDHKAGITASAKALQHLTDMKMFSPPIGNDIIEGVSKLGDDFKLQAPATRLEIYQLILGLLQDDSVSNDLGQRHGNTCDFMTGLLKVCSSERDPKNLMKWFEILKIFLQKFSPSDDVTSEVFKTFSAYFPITLRAAATSSGITPEDLKAALRSCFSAHHRLASHAIPYLIAKLDQGDAVTVTVKVDILQTIQACVTLYDNPKQSVVPYADQIWSALKYEVRKGEVEDTIEATLKVIQFLPARMEEDDLRLFFNNAWRDLAEDIASEKYALQAARLLAATFRETPQAFSMIGPALAHVKTTVLSTQSSSLKKDLLTLLNWVLTARSNLIDNHTFDQSLVNPLKDELFGDTFFQEIYLPLWNALSDRPYTERLEIFPKLIEGMATLVNQKSYEIEAHRLVTDPVCTEIFNLLSETVVTYPLRSRRFINTSQEAADDKISDYAIRYLATLALGKAMPQYPQGFQQVLLTYIELVKELFPARCHNKIFVYEIKNVGETLCDIAYSKASKASFTLSDSMTLIHAFLDGFFWMLTFRAPPRYWSAFISILNAAITRSLENIAARLALSEVKPRPLSKEEYGKLVAVYEQLLQAQHEKGTANSLAQTTKDLRASGYDDHQQVLAYCLCVLERLYHRFTDIYKVPNVAGDKGWMVGLHRDFVTPDWKLAAQQDIALHQLAQLATSIVRALSEDEQKALQLDQEAFRLLSTGSESFESICDDESFKTMAEISPMHQYRTAPLSMGILQGLFPGAMDHEYHLHALQNLKKVLLQTPTDPTSEVTRVTLDTIWTILSNKFVIKGDERKTEWLALLDDIAMSFITIWSGIEGRNPPTDVIRVLRSVLHFLSGDVARFQGNDPRMNGLLRLVCDKGLIGTAPGRQLAKSFEILLSPQECLRKENHAIRKRLADAWIYHQAVKPYLRRCLPSIRNLSTMEIFNETLEYTNRNLTTTSGREYERLERLMAETARRAVRHGRGSSDIPSDEAVHRSVATFSMLKYARFEHYADDVPQIVRIIIFSLRALEPGVEVSACLQVLLEILTKDPEAFQGHLPSLSKSLAKVYRSASPLGSAQNGPVMVVTDPLSFESGLVSPRDHRALAILSPQSKGTLADPRDNIVTCRKFVVDIFNKLPATYKQRELLPLRPALSRTMAAALNDCVREIRQTARAATEAWDKIDQADGADGAKQG